MENALHILFDSEDIDHGTVYVGLIRYSSKPIIAIPLQKQTTSELSSMTSVHWRNKCSRNRVLSTAGGPHKLLHNSLRARHLT